ncbi:MAG TPA: MATE family efflux transporter [Mesotoga sp.]|jgi:putative MATE family efflux protein|uniref:MATE family efflux transporter n=1 Tax=unclassified Mesotoga TaxID=1184398 RepID=UPI000A6D6B97|nr:MULTISPECIES: MATE family efflux transporter [unclassified Mesotoga]HNU23896.1 MATE family efflux transporter [Mesotoga sp.]
MAKDIHKMLGEERIGRLLLSLSLPATIGMLVQAMYNFVDTIYVGRGVGSMGIAGISISFPVQIFVMAFAQMFGIGGASVISRALGEKNHEKARRAAGNVMAFSIAFGLAMTLLGYFFIDQLLIMLGASEAIIPYAREYLSIILLGSAFFSFGMAMSHVIRAEGKPKIAMAAMLISAVLNIILDPIFIFTLNMGIRGAALATVLSQAITSIYILFYFTSGKSLLRISLASLIPEWTILKETVSVGLSAFSRQVAGSVLAVVMNNSLVFYGGDIAVAVYGIINRLLMVFIMPMFGVNQGFLPIVGYNYGAKKMRRARESVKLASAVTTLIALFSAIIMFFFARQLISIFSDEIELIEPTISALRIVILAIPTIGIQVIASGMFQALGKAIPALFLSLLRQIIILIPLILVIPRFLGINGIWISFPLADLIAFAISLVFYLRELKTFRSSELSAEVGTTDVA